MSGRLAAALAASALAIAGCGDDGGGERPALKVSAAASLKEAFTQYGAGFPSARARFSFAGSDELAAQIRRGARPDVFASANTTLPRDLFAARMVERPVVFAGNRLVLAGPARGGEVTSLEAAARPGVKVAMGAATVPIGSYTREVLARLPPAVSRGIAANVRSNEPDVKGIAAKLTQGAADAGFVYITDVEATNGRLRAIELPASVRPRVAYAVAVVRGTEHPGAARAFVAGLLRGEGRSALLRAGFEPPPR